VAAWEGFATMSRGGDGRPRLDACADYGGPDEDPTPLLILIERNADEKPDDYVQLDEGDLRWLVDEVAPVVLKRMGERP
jgi:hypothetical protein